MLHRIANQKIVFFWIVFAANFFVKLYNIGNSSLSHDEALSVKNCFLEFGHIKHESEWDANPPFYYYCLWVWTKLFGISEVSIRALSALFSALAAAFIGRFVLQVTSLGSAISTTLLFLCNPLIIFYAQEARCYSLEIFLTVLNVIVLFRYLKEPSKLTAFCLGLLLFLLFYTHYISALLIFCEIIALLFLRGSKKIELAITAIVPIILILWRFTKKQWKVILRMDGSPDGSGNTPLSSPDILGQTFDELFAIRYFLIIILFIVVVYFVRNKKSLDTQSNFGVFLIGASMFVLLGYYLIGTQAHVFSTRYVLYAFVPIVIGIGIINVPVQYKYILTIILVLFYITKIEFGKRKGMDFRLASAIAKDAQKVTKAKIVLQTHDITPNFTYYYDKVLFARQDRAKSEVLEKYNIIQLDNLESLSEVDDFRDKYQIVVQSFLSEQTLKSTALEFSKYRYKPIFSTSLEGVKISIFKKF